VARNPRCSTVDDESQAAPMLVDLIRFRGHPNGPAMGYEVFHGQEETTELHEGVQGRGGRALGARGPLDRAGRTRLDLTEPVRSWVKQAAVGQGDGPAEALTTDEGEELRRLRRENRQLREEREILKKAAAFFAKETK